MCAQLPPISIICGVGAPIGEKLQHRWTVLTSPLRTVPNSCSCWPARNPTLAWSAPFSHPQVHERSLDALAGRRGVLVELVVQGRNVMIQNGICCLHGARAKGGELGLCVAR